MKNRSWTEGLDDKARTKIAASKIEKVLDGLITAYKLHCSNDIVNRSDFLSSQIPRSYAAHAFNTFKDAMFFSEALKLCTLWDKPRSDRNSLPTIVALVRSEGVFAIARRGRNTERELRDAIDLVDDTQRSELLAGIMQFRDCDLAHALDPNAKKFPELKPKYGHERELLEISRRAIDGLNFAIRESDFQWEDFFRQEQRNSKALWHGTTFEVLE